MTCHKAINKLLEKITPLHDRYNGIIHTDCWKYYKRHRITCNVFNRDMRISFVIGTKFQDIIIWQAGPSTFIIDELHRAASRTPSASVIVIYPLALRIHKFTASEIPSPIDPNQQSINFDIKDNP